MIMLGTNFGALAFLMMSASVQTPTVSGPWTLDPLAPECRGGAGASGVGGSCSDG